jgi:putative ABC transport system permease protein
VRHLLHFLVTDADRRAIENDLAELYELRRREFGDKAAEQWLRRQRRVGLFHLALERARASLRGNGAIAGNIARDASYCVRSLIRTPALATTIVLTVGLGLGTTAALITIARTVLLEPLPYANPDSLVWIYTDTPPYWFRFSVVDYRALEADHPAFTEVAGYQNGQVTVSEGGRAERLMSKTVTGSYFRLLGHAPALGRLFEPADEGRGEPIVVLGHGYWTRRFGGDRSVLGRAVQLDGVSHTIVGVMSRSAGPLETNVDFYTPANWPQPRRKGPFFVTVVGRLRPDVSSQVARETLRATNARLFPIWRSSYQDEKSTWNMVELKTRVVGSARSPLLLVLGAVACVLLIACANTINLLIARALGRRRDIAIRTALGASRGRLVQQSLVETTLLTGGAALVGLAAAAGALQLVKTYGPGYVPRLDEIEFSWRVLGPLGALSLFSALLIASVQVVQSIRGTSAANPGPERTGTDGPTARRVRRALVAAEFALATPLLLGAVLIASSLFLLHRVEVGIDTERVLTAEVSLPSARYANEAAARTFWQRALEQLSATPGVEAAALTDSRPPHEGYNQNNFDLEARPTSAGESQPICPWVAASPGFFKAMGLRLEEGRLFEPTDLRPDEPLLAVIVDRAWAKRFFPDGSALGRRMREGGCTECPWITVVGVVSSVKFSGLDGPDDGAVYYPFVDVPTGYLVVRTAGDPRAFAPVVRRIVDGLDPALAVSDVATGDELVASSLAVPRYLGSLVAMFAIAALLLSIVGVYGVMTHFVQQHTREIGIRLALGGEPSAMRRMIVGQGIRLALLGVAVGLGAALWGSRLLTGFLFGVRATDPVMLTAASVVLIALAALACIAPARRAAKLDPAQILREV